jgi:hypothetical protein
MVEVGRNKDLRKEKVYNFIMVLVDVAKKRNNNIYLSKKKA